MSGNTSYSSILNNERKPCRVSVCTSALPHNVEGFRDELISRLPHLDVRYFQLPYNDLDRFSIKGKGMDVMILCHSIDNRRCSITDVTDALYQKFLPNAAKTLGKQKVCVIVHDYPPEMQLNNHEKYTTEIASLKSKQWTTFESADLVMMCGKLAGPVELQEHNWDDLKRFLQNADEKRQNSSTGYTTSLKKNKFSAFALIFALILFFLFLAGEIYFIVVVTSSSPEATTIIMQPSTTLHPITTVPSMTGTPVSSKGTSPPLTTIPSVTTNLTTDFTIPDVKTTEITSPTPAIITDATPNSTTSTEKTFPSPTTIPPIPTDLAPNSTGIH